MITITHRAAAVVATGLLSLGVYAQKQPKNTAVAKRFGKQTEFINCGTVQNNAGQNQQKFEQWLAPKVAAAKTASLLKSTNEVVTIPVVVHVIHDGDAVGQNENIAYEQVLSQITVLNQDFRRMFDTPGYNTNTVGADVEIEFCLAQQDPDGLLTTGVTRHNMGQATWDMEEVEVLKTQTQWNPEKYLNIWVVSQVTISNAFLLAGYAQFPTQSGLEGLDGETSTANTDGVVIGAPYFGSETIYPEGFYEAGTVITGRSATHEVGHFFGLRHIWGDEEECQGTDYCDDTPVHATANQGCPAVGYDSCPDDPGVDMIANYMDYTSDECKNVFTADQKARIQAVLANSPRRNSLTTSNGCVPGIVLENDGTLNIQGLNGGCGSTFAPEIVLTNNGSEAITAAVISYQIDEQEAQTYTFTGNLAAGDDTTITLDAVTFTPGEHTFTTAIVTVNGVADEAPSNDNKSLTFTIAQTYNTSQYLTLTINTDDYGDETIWILLNSDEEPVASNINLQTGVPNYYESNQTYEVNILVDSNQCYTFAMLDMVGDGMCCQYGEGSYSLTTANGTVIVAGGDFGQQELTDFGIDNALSTNNFTADNSISLYPNPANSVINISTASQTQLPDSYTVYNSLGQVMGNGKVSSNNHPVNISNYATGVYFIKLQSAAGAQTLQFIKH